MLMALSAARLLTLSATRLLAFRTRLLRRDCGGHPRLPLLRLRPFAHLRALVPYMLLMHLRPYAAAGNSQFPQTVEGPVRQ